MGVLSLSFLFRFATSLASFSQVLLYLPLALDVRPFPLPETTIKQA
jgi:hypothetical protein